MPQFTKATLLESRGRYQAVICTLTLWHFCHLSLSLSLPFPLSISPFLSLSDFLSFFLSFSLSFLLSFFISFFLSFFLSLSLSISLALTFCPCFLLSVSLTLLLFHHQDNWLPVHPMSVCSLKLFSLFFSHIFSLSSFFHFISFSFFLSFFLSLSLSLFLSLSPSLLIRSPFSSLPSWFYMQCLVLEMRKAPHIESVCHTVRACSYLAIEMLNGGEMHDAHPH